MANHRIAAGQVHVVSEGCQLGMLDLGFLEAAYDVSKIPGGDVDHGEQLGGAIGQALRDDFAERVAEALDLLIREGGTHTKLHAGLEAGLDEGVVGTIRGRQRPTAGSVQGQSHQGRRFGTIGRDTLSPAQRGALEVRRSGCSFKHIT